MALLAVAVVLLPNPPAATADARRYIATKVLRNGKLETRSGIAWMNRTGAIVNISATEYRRRTGTRYLRTTRVPAKWKDAAIDHVFTKNGVRFFEPFPDDAPQYRAAVDAIVQGATAPVYIKRINKKVGRGLFAAENIKAGDVIGAYAGVVKSPRDACRSDYAWSLPLLLGKPGTDPGKPGKGRAELWPSLDGVDGNYLRFVNHSPDGLNVRPYQLFHQGMWHVIYRATRDIPKDAQLLTSYGQGYFSQRPGAELNLTP